MDAITLKSVTKRFKKRTIRHEYTTLKSELVNLIRRKKKSDEGGYIEVLKGIDLSIPRGQTVGIIGHNGQGKSTLLKLMTGIYSPTTGSIDVNGRISALLELGAGFHPDFSGRENILINGIIVGMSRAEIKKRMNEIIEFAELGEFIDQPVRNYSSGMYMRLAFSVATHVSPDILIVDEILAVGDAHFRRKSMAKMNEFKTSGNTIVLVTHDISTVATWCDHAVWVDKGVIRSQGAPRDVVEEYRREVAEAERAAEEHAHHEAPMSLGAAAALKAAEAAPVSWTESIRFSDTAGHERSVFAPGETIHAEIAARPGVPAGPLRASITRQDDGLLISEFSWRPTGNELAAGESLRLQISNLRLNSGSYTFAVGPATDEAHPGAFLTMPLSIATDTEPAPGLMVPDHRWTVVGQNESQQPLRVVPSVRSN